MNRQMKRRMNKSLNLKSQDIDNLSEHFRDEAIAKINKKLKKGDKNEA